MDSYEQIRDEWISKKKVAKFFGIFYWELADMEETVMEMSQWQI